VRYSHKNQSSKHIHIVKGIFHLEGMHFSLLMLPFVAGIKVDLTIMLSGNFVEKVTFTIKVPGVRGQTPS